MIKQEKLFKDLLEFIEYWAWVRSIRDRDDMMEEVVMDYQRGDGSEEEGVATEIVDDTCCHNHVGHNGQ